MAASRRDLIMRLASVGGFAAAYAAMRTMGLLGPDEAVAGPPALAPASGAGARVLILGGGVAGLSAAYELGRAGYACTVLEARTRPGGRNWSIRRGTRLELTDGTSQTCAFDEGLYFNAGPARIPTHHQATLGYCRELGVEVETLVNACRSARLQSDKAFDGRPIQMREAIYGVRGHVSELLAKALNAGALNAEVTPEDKERLVEFLRRYGGLAPDSVYRGSMSGGYKTPPAAGAQRAVSRDPIDLHALLSADIWSGALFEDAIDMQTTMLQPVGGMDRIPYAFAARLGKKVRYGCVVTRIGRTARGVSVTYRQGGKEKAAEADYCLCTIPLTVLRRIPADFSPAYRDAIATTPYGDACKVAFQSERFWEHEDQIYGGLSFTDRDTNACWYPSGGFHRPQGVILGAYNFDGVASRFGRQPLAAQIDEARGSIERLHPGKSQRLKHGIAIHWAKVPFNLAPWVDWSESGEDPRYTLLSEPDGPFYFAGEHLSHVGAWQQGAIVSAWRAVGQIDARRRQGQVVADARIQRSRVA